MGLTQKGHVIFLMGAVSFQEGSLLGKRKQDKKAAWRMGGDRKRRSPLDGQSPGCRLLVWVAPSTPLPPSRHVPLQLPPGPPSLGVWLQEDVKSPRWTLGFLFN